MCIRDRLQDAGRDPYQQVRFERDHHTSEIHEHFDELEGKTVRLAGRMMSKRIMGKASFSDLSDRYGRLQMYIKRDNVGDEVYKGYKKFDIGDIIGVEGEVFRTQKGEISVAVHELTLQMCIRDRCMRTSRSPCAQSAQKGKQSRNACRMCLIWSVCRKKRMKNP